MNGFRVSPFRTPLRAVKLEELEVVRGRRLPGFRQSDSAGHRRGQLKLTAELTD